MVLGISCTEQWLTALDTVLPPVVMETDSPICSPLLMSPTLVMTILLLHAQGLTHRFLGLHYFFSKQGYQIPKGWNVIYSICDTHDVADSFTNKEEFNPDRFTSLHPEDTSRFSFIPFGGGLRSCVGKEFAKILLKIFTVELARRCDWQLLNGPPTMKTSPTVYPVDNLPARFTHFQGDI